MNALGHVLNLQPVLDLAMGIIKGVVVSIIDMFLFKGADKAFNDGIVIRTFSSNTPNLLHFLCPINRPHYNSLHTAPSIL